MPRRLVVTRGFGNGVMSGNINRVITRGYSIAPNIFECFGVTGVMSNTIGNTARMSNSVGETAKMSSTIGKTAKI